MKKLFLTLIVSLGIFCISTIQAQNIENLLENIQDIVFTELKSPKGFEKTYELSVKQLINHADSSKGIFNQKVFLTHRGFDCPTVFMSGGYQVNYNSIYELTELLQANQISVEHRCFGKSVPDSLVYEYLNLEQATADLHHINQLFKSIYSGKWISSGISKGGQTAIFYKYFFPKDIDVCVPYVAPLTNALEDERIYTFLDTVGTDECREKIKSFQIRLLENRETVIPLLREYSKQSGLNFTYLSLEEAFEYAVMEYPFTFWQWGGKCKDIPDNKTSLKKAVKHFTLLDPFSLFGDGAMERLHPNYYQAMTEMGYYGYETKRFEGLLKALPTNVNPLATFLPGDFNVTFNETLLKDVHKWLAINGNKFIYIYGSKDPWSACAIEPSSNVDSKFFMLSGKHHGTARIANMNPDEKQTLISTLENWLSIEIE